MKSKTALFTFQILQTNKRGFQKGEQKTSQKLETFLRALLHHDMQHINFH